MATIYRFIVENQMKESAGRKGEVALSTRNKGAGKKGTSALSIFSSPRGGVEHNRRLRAINPLLNRATGGWWEKGMRVGRAGVGVVNTAREKGIKATIGGVGFTIILAFIIQQLLRLQNKNLEWGKQRNTQNYKQMETGISAVHGQYQLTANVISGRRTYNENK